MKYFFSDKWTLAVKVLPFIVVIILLKLAFHQFGLEVISLSPLFNSIIAANVFLLGFLLAGTLTDYKESERLPGELAASIETIYDEFEITYKNKKAKVATDAIRFLSGFTASVIDWFYKKERTKTVMDKLCNFNDIFLSFEPLTQPNFIVRLKQEQHAIRKIMIRIHTIRETSFVSVGYAIAELTTGLLIIGFLFAKIDPFYDSLFFVGLGAFLMIYIIFLIKDLDNPFDHYTNGREAANVSLKPLLDVRKRIQEELENVENDSKMTK